MTRAQTQTQRHAALRERKRAKGLQRRTVWLTEVSLDRLDRIKDAHGLTQDAAFYYALRKVCENEGLDPDPFG